MSQAPSFLDLLHAPPMLVLYVMAAAVAVALIFNSCGGGRS